MTDNYGVLTVGSTSSGKVKIGQQVSDVLPNTAIQARLPGGNEWVVNNAQTVAIQSLMMTGAPLTVSYNAVGGATENSGFFEIQQNGDFNYISSSMTYARGTAAASLGLAAPPSGVVDSTPGLYAFDSTPGLIVTPRFAHACPTERFTKNCTSVASFMDNLVQTENDQWSSFQDVYNPTSATPPEEACDRGLGAGPLRFPYLSGKLVLDDAADRGFDGCQRCAASRDSAGAVNVDDGGSRFRGSGLGAILDKDDQRIHRDAGFCSMTRQASLPGLLSTRLAAIFGL